MRMHAKADYARLRVSAVSTVHIAANGRFPPIAAIQIVGYRNNEPAYAGSKHLQMFALALVHERGELRRGAAKSAGARQRNRGLLRLARNDGWSQWVASTR
jgi:hypothetical protein